MQMKVQQREQPKKNTQSYKISIKRPHDDGAREDCAHMKSSQQAATFHVFAIFATLKIEISSSSHPRKQAPAKTTTSDAISHSACRVLISTIILLSLLSLSYDAWLNIKRASTSHTIAQQIAVSTRTVSHRPHEIFMSAASC